MLYSKDKTPFENDETSPSSTAMFLCERYLKTSIESYLNYENKRVSLFKPAIKKEQEFNGIESDEETVSRKPKKVVSIKEWRRTNNIF